MEAITCNHQINTFHCQQRRMEHKGGHWLVHEECIVRTAVCQKSTSQAEAMSDSEKITLATIELCLAEGINQSSS